MAGPKAVRRPPDLVLIRWTGSPRRIAAFRIIGSADPCRSTLVIGGLLSRALGCFLDDFRIVYQKQTSVGNGYLLLQRFRNV
ncbi:hypothetical protein [Paenibacillus cremeus]|uniref:Uncharacterized protein n=1 Tax=Paenibacillus cremeus TaxID=2163881 RepID=A0A559JVW9_9BACL|nr:hypothetical protein [Paenibacillus cremeus]TVY03930.1 hypothetical protein FPZ49_31300 [Paenibacillus cremeus]